MKINDCKKLIIIAIMALASAAVIGIADNGTESAKAYDSYAITGDIDGDGDVDQNDLNILLLDRNKTVQESACGASCDLDKDGIITVLDARKMVLLCTLPRCAVAP